jgi:transcriptional regulator with XRE-family HTH domain
MATVMAKPTANPGPGRSRAQDVDRHVGARMRERRIMLGLTQQQMGINRIAAGRLYNIAQALGVDVGYFFEGLHSGDQAFKATPQQRMLLELARNFISIPTRKHQEAICSLARALNSSDQ